MFVLLGNQYSIVRNRPFTVRSETFEMRILITGGAGYVGAALTEHLLRLGHQVTIIDRLVFGLPFGLIQANFAVYRGDVRDISGVTRILPGHDAIVHLAFASNDPAYELDPLQARSVNILSIGPLLRAAKRSGVARFVFLSSCSVYGRAGTGKTNEDGRTAPITEYAKHKLVCEATMAEYAEERLTCTVLRSATVCGLSKRQRFDLLEALPPHIRRHQLVTGNP